MCMCMYVCVRVHVCVVMQNNYEMHLYLFNRDVKCRLRDAVVKVLC